MFKRKRKINMISLATFLLAIVSPALINGRVCGTLVGEPKLPKKIKPL